MGIGRKEEGLRQLGDVRGKRQKEEEMREKGEIIHNLDSEGTNTQQVKEGGWGRAHGKMNTNGKLRW